MGMSIKKSSLILSLWSFYLLASVESGPLNLEEPSKEVANNSLAEFDSTTSKGCRYKAVFYSNGDDVSTDEPCLACQCKGTIVVCKLRICPEIPVPPPPGCIVVHKAKSCCSQLICHGQEIVKKISREQRFPLSVSNETLLASVSNEDAGYCVLDGTVYAEGSAMRSSTLCQYCFCIKGEMKCSSPQCVIPLKGCKPQFRSWACCPTHYDCGQSNETAILKTIPSSTQVPQFLKGCLVNGQFVPEGEPVLPVQLSGFGNSTGATNVCQTCFCMGGVVHCQPLECDQPIDGCMPIKEDGHCCPDRYDCSKSQPLLTSTTARSVLTSSSANSILPAVNSDSPETTTSSEVSSNEGITEIVMSLKEFMTTKSSESLPSTTVTSTDEEFVQTTANNHNNDNNNNNNDDSFERIATVMTGSSEETSSVIPSQILKKHVSATTIGGFKNRSDLGSREERRSKDGDELSLRQSTEDDERDELMFPVFDTTLSNAIEDLGATASFDDSTYTPITDPEAGSLFSTEADMTSVETWKLENVTENYIQEMDSDDAASSIQVENLNHDLFDLNGIETSTVPDAPETQTPTAPDTPETQTPTVSDSPETHTPDVSDTLETQTPSVSGDPEAQTQITTSPTPTTTTTLASTPDVVTKAVPFSTTPQDITTSDSSSTTTTEFLKFIPFVEEDALFNLENDTIITINNENLEENFDRTANKSYEEEEPLISSFLSESILSLLKPLQLKFMNGTEESLIPEGSQEVSQTLKDALPIIVETDSEIPHEFPQSIQYNITASLPASTSLYSNGYYPHGDIIKDDGPPGELQITEGKISSKDSHKFEDDEDEVNQSAEQTVFQLNFKDKNGESEDMIEISFPPSTSTASTPPIETTKIPEPPLQSIPFNEKVIPSYSPVTGQPEVDLIDVNVPSRTYTKFGMQDSPFYRYDHHGLPPVPLDTSGFIQNPPQQQYHHRYYNEPENIPQSRIPNPYNYYSPSRPSGTDVQNKNRGQSIGMLPPLYKNNNFFYDDSSIAVDSYEEYETYANPSSSNGLPASVAPATLFSSTSTPRSTSHSIQFLGERVRMPSYNQQRATSTPKYKYAHKSTLSRRLTTERTTTPMTDFAKPMHPFSFNLPRTQDNLYNLGIKLSGCNVVGKMYSVGEIIEELSSDCLRCMCSDIGVHCAELKCKK